MTLKISRLTLLFAALITLVVLMLYIYWFAVANRYVIFLYFHLDSRPLDAETNSRYWMTGFVAGGIVLSLYVMANWILGRLASVRHGNYAAPNWLRLWMLCLLPLVPSILLVTTRLNTPTLPLNTAAGVVIALALGLALALAPGNLAAERPGALVWLALDSLVLLFPLTLLHAIEIAYLKPEVVPPIIAIIVVIFSLLACLGVVWIHDLPAVGSGAGLHLPPRRYLLPAFVGATCSCLCSITFIVATFHSAAISWLLLSGSNSSSWR